MLALLFINRVFVLNDVAALSLSGRYRSVFRTNVCRSRYVLMTKKGFRMWIRVKCKHARVKNYYSSPFEQG